MELLRVELFESQSACHGHEHVSAGGHEGAHCVSVLYESFIALYTIASILLILYYILKYYRKIRMEKKREIHENITRLDL
ncbi:hypothetical protein PPRFG01_0049800 [Plasmodium sp.]|nr:hypothetical protein PPRFG01_0049800 [Plasmodium sp.]